MTENAHILQDSVKKQLSQRFRNLRRTSHQPQVQGDSVPGSSTAVAIADTASSLPDEDYKKSLATLRSEWEKDKTGAMALMAITYNKRREWISREADSIHAILQEFPCYKSYDFISCHVYLHCNCNVRHIRKNCHSYICMQILWEFERMQGNKVHSMKKRLSDCLNKIKPNLDIDTKNVYDWQETFAIFEKELLEGRSQAKKPLFPIVVSTLCNLMTACMCTCKHA